MGELELQIIDKAKKAHKKIYPCASKKSLSECFTKNENHLLFWFNTEDSSTHVVAHPLSENKKVHS